MLKKIINSLPTILMAFVILLVIVAAYMRLEPLGEATRQSKRPKPLVVLGGSMQPAIRLGSLVLTSWADSREIEIGDIIVFTTPQGKGFTTHRVTEIIQTRGTRVFKTKGDANRSQDDWTVSSKNVLGKVTIAIPYVGYLVHFAKKPLGFVLLFVVPIVLLLSGEIVNIVRYIRDADEGKRLSKLPDNMHERDNPTNSGKGE